MADWSGVGSSLPQPGLLSPCGGSPAEVVVIPPIVVVVDDVPPRGWLLCLGWSTDGPSVLREGLQVCWSRHQEFPVTSVPGLLLAVSFSRDLVVVYVGYLVWYGVPRPLRGAGGCPPNVGPVPQLYVHQFGPVFGVVPGFHLLFGLPVFLSSVAVVFPSGDCPKAW